MPPTLSARLFFKLVACVTLAVLAAPLPAQEYQTDGHSFSVTPLPDWVDWAALPQRSDQRPGQAAAYRLVDR